LLWAGIIVGDLNSDFASIFSLAVQVVPKVVLATPGHYNLLQAHPAFSNEVGLLVVIEDGDFQLIVVGRIVDRKSKLLIPSILELVDP
jgi:hypothetical protein